MSGEENKRPQVAGQVPANDDAGERSADDTKSDKSPNGVDNSTTDAADEPTSASADAQSIDELDFGDEKIPVEDKPVEPDLTESDDESELAKAQARAEENWERVLRIQADMENQRKRAQKDVENARKFALEAIVNDLLPVRDSLEMGLAAAQETEADAVKIIEGSELTLKMLSQAFEKYNIIEINPIDQKFDPEFHQAMSMQEVQGKESNTVTGVLQKGYTLNDRLIRPALVMVAK